MADVVQLHKRVNPSVMLDHDRWNADLARSPRRSWWSQMLALLSWSK